jgi:hypothetical protein
MESLHEKYKTIFISRFLQFITLETHCKYKAMAGASKQVTTVFPELPTGVS